MKISSFINKKNIIIATLLLSFLTTLFFSFQLQKSAPLSTSSRAMEIPNINVSSIHLPPVQIGQISSLPNISVAPLQIPPVNIVIPPISNPQIQFPAVPSIPSIPTSSVPDLGSYVSQGAAIIQQIMANPNANQIIAMFLGSILSPPPSSSNTPSADTNSPPAEQGANPVIQPTSPPPEPKIVLQTCKEGDGTKTNTCPAIYYENGRLVSRQCGSTGWCFYTCYAPNNDRLDQVQCWQDQDLHCITPNCSCKDTLTNSRENCPNLNKRDGIYYLRGCDIKTNLGETKCLHTCFKLTNPDIGLDNEIVDCWPGQNKWETPPPAAVPTSPSGNQPAPTAASAGKCHGKIPKVDAINRPASEWELPNNGKTPCECVNAPIVGQVCTELKCSNCPQGTCECEDMPMKMPPFSLSCTNGGKGESSKCQP